MRNSFLIIVLGLLGLSSPSFAQRIGKSDFGLLKEKEDSLKYFANQIVNGREATDRFHADSQFTRMLVRALKTQQSFYFPFDSLETISRLYAPDTSFRIFTWQVVRDENTYRRHGAIQMRTEDGSLKLFPLLDYTRFSQNWLDTITNNEAWVGAIYYNIVLRKTGNQKYYTLFGYDEHNIRSTRKIIDVLSFNSKGQPVFGAPIFSFAEDTLRKPAQNRFMLEYKKEGNARVQFDPELDMIIYDHLIPENNEPLKKYTYIPDGDYEGFKWKEGRWVHIEKVFNYKLKDGEAPVAVPLVEDKLNVKPEPKPVKPKTGSKPKS